MADFPLNITSYSSQKDSWPSSGKHILAQFDEHSIIVYQAYNPSSAKAIVDSQSFHSDDCKRSGYSMSRMSWIKTNFLWMMFRSGWASKPNQERILALRLSRKGFEEILSKAVASKHGPGANPSKEDEVRLQWDPDHLPNGEKVESRRAIQLGLRGAMLERLSREFLLQVYDITDFVIENRQFVDDHEKLMIPVEKVYSIDRLDLAKNPS